VAQLIVRNLEDDIRDKLREMAAVHDRSMEEEVREILRAAVLRASLQPVEKLGTRLTERFKECGLDAEIREIRGQTAKPADLEP